MFAMNLVDISDKNIIYGILICENDTITATIVQNKIYEIKELFNKNGLEWIIEDVIKNIPTEWNVRLQKTCEIIGI